MITTIKSAINTIVNEKAAEAAKIKAYNEYKLEEHKKRVGHLADIFESWLEKQSDVFVDQTTKGVYVEYNVSCSETIPAEVSKDKLVLQELESRGYKNLKIERYSNTMYISFLMERDA